MENKRNSKKTQSNYKDNLPCVRKIIKHQEKLYKVVYRDGKWIRRRNVRIQKKGVPK